MPFDSSVRKDKKEGIAQETYGVNDIPDFERNDTDTHEISASIPTPPPP